jgi:hypothetical protein
MLRHGGNLSLPLISRALTDKLVTLDERPTAQRIGKSPICTYDSAKGPRNASLYYGSLYRSAYQKNNNFNGVKFYKAKHSQSACKLTMAVPYIFFERGIYAYRHP